MHVFFKLLRIFIPRAHITWRYDFSLLAKRIHK